MSSFNTERPKPWYDYTGVNPTPSQSGGGGGYREAPWKGFGTSVDAISFGFVATAILVSMFIIMAIFEHLIRPKPTFSSPQDAAQRSLEMGEMRVRIRTLEKLGNSQNMQPTSYSSDFSVLMPGEQCPTFIAQPAPLPCPREEIHWPSHGNAFVAAP